MTQAAKSQEPSMEEILASIRRIIADDDATKSVQRAAEAPMAQPPAPPQPAPAPPPRAAYAPPPPPAPPRLHLEPEPEPSPPFEEPAAAAEAGTADQASDILDLTEAMASPPQPSAVNSPSSAMATQPLRFRTIEAGSDVEFDETSEQPAAPAVIAGGEERGERLISRETSAAVDSAFNALAQTVLVQNARTLEDLVREMLRPMLKSWLERVSRGR